MQAIILAGGLGTRLRSVIGDAPKPMAPVGDKPFLEHLMGVLADAGFTHVILSVGYRSGQIVDHFGDRFAAISIDYAVEATPLGTGGAIRAGLARARPGPCFVLNGDTYVDVDYRTMQATHVAARSRISMAVCAVADVGRFGALQIDAGIVTAMREKGETGPGSINAGVYLVDDTLFDESRLPDRFSFESDFLSPGINALKPRAFEAGGTFLDIGIPEDYAKADALFARIGERR